MQLVPRVYCQQKFDEYFCVYASWCNFWQENPVVYTWEMFAEELKTAIRQQVKGKQAQDQEIKSIFAGAHQSVFEDAKIFLLKHRGIKYKFLHANKHPEEIKQIKNGFLSLSTKWIKQPKNADVQHFNHSVCIKDGYFVDSLPYKPQVHLWTGNPYNTKSHGLVTRVSTAIEVYL